MHYNGTSLVDTLSKEHNNTFHCSVNDKFYGPYIQDTKNS